MLCVGNGSHFCTPSGVLSGVSGAGILKRHQHNAAVRKHGTITRCCFDNGAASKTVGQH